MATIKKIKKAQSGIKADSATMVEVRKAFKNFGPDSAKIAKEHLAKEKKMKDSIKANKPMPKQKSGGTTAKDGKWIQKAIKKPGALRAQLGAEPGKPIAAAKLAKASKAKGKLGQRARLAMTLKKMKK